MIKKCRSCKIEKEETQFYKRPSNSDGLYSYCKECTLERNKKTREKKPEFYKESSRSYKEKNRKILSDKSKDYYYRNRQKCLETVSKYREKNKRIISFKESIKRSNDKDRFQRNREKHLKWSKNNREMLNEYQRQWYQNNKEKRKAHVVLNRAVKSGIVMRPDKCSECFKNCKPDGHHSDYNKPLEIVWLCRACHSRKSPRNVIKWI